MTEASSSNGSSSKSTKSKKFGIFIGIALVVFVAVLGFELFFNSAKNPPSSISGRLDFNGIKPADQPNQALSIKLMQREKGELEFRDTGVSIPVADRAEWSWTGALSGITYELQAYGYFGTQKFTSSNIIVATAPATDLNLTFNVTMEDVPQELRPTPTPAPDVVVKPVEASVSGSIIINGFLPSGSFVTIFGRKAGDENTFQPALERLPAKTGMTWSFNQAEAGVTYDYQAELYNSAGMFIGESPYITVTAPAANEVVTINSMATQPSVPAVISGVVRLQGPVAQNSTILVLQRKVGDTEFSVINRYPAVTNTAWSWSNAVSGTRYEITAPLQVNEQNTASGNTQTVAAPAADVNITIDTGLNLSAPTQLVSVDCGVPDGTNHYNARISIPQQNGAQLYYLEVGTSAGSGNIFANTVKPNQVTTVYIPGNSPHFARYSFSACTDCNLKEYGQLGWVVSHLRIYLPGRTGNPLY